MSELQELVSDPLFKRSTPDQQASILGVFFDQKVGSVPAVKSLRPEILQLAKSSFVSRNIPSGLLGGKEAQIVRRSSAVPAEPSPDSLIEKASDVATEAAKSAVLAPVALVSAPASQATNEVATFQRKGLIREGQGDPRGKLESLMEASLRGAMLGGVVDRQDEPRTLKNTLLDILEIGGTLGGFGAMGAGKLARVEKIVQNASKVASRMGPDEAKLLTTLKEEIAAAKPTLSKPPIAPKPTQPPTQQVGQFNIDRFTDPDVRGILAQVEQDTATQAKIIAQKRGVISDEQLKLLADQVDLTPEKLRKMAPGTVLNAEEMLKANQVLGGVGKATANLVEKYKVAKEAGDPKLLGAIVGDAQNVMSPMVDVMVKTRAIASELGRALRQQRVAIQNLSPIEKNLLDMSMKEGGILSAERTEELLSKLSSVNLNDPLAITRALARELKPSVSEKFLEVVTSMKLTNPITFFRNTVGNSMAVLTRLAEKGAQGPIDYLRSGFTKTPRERFLGEAGSYAFGLRHGMHDAAIRFMAGLRGTDPTAAVKATEVVRGPAVGGMAGKVVSLPFRMLTATDEFFKTLLRRGELYSVAFRKAAKEGVTGPNRWSRVEQLVANPTDDMVKAADTAATEYTFQAPLGEFAQSLNRARNSLGGLPKLILPFFKTPVNVGKFIIQRSPMGVAAPRNIRGIAAGGAEATEALARLSIGSSISGLMTWLALEGYITGAGPQNKAERDLLQRSGWQPRSLRIGNKYISYSGFDPLASTMGNAADIAEAWLRRKEQPTSDMIAKMAFGVMENITDQPFLTGINDFLNALRDERKMGRFVDNFAAGFVPTGVGLVARSIDPVVRKPEGIIQTVQSRVPGLSKKVPPKLNAFGEPVARERSIPVATSTARGGQLESELQRLQKTVNFTISLRSNRINGRKLDQQEMQELQTRAGQEIKAKVEDLIQSDRYQGLTDPMRKRAIEKIERDTAEKITDSMAVGVELRSLGLPNIQRMPLPESIKRTLVNRLKTRIDTKQYKDKPDASRRDAIKEKMRDVLSAFTGN